MKINQIIREKRMEKGYTQEQVAQRLGVTASAVNKWERGSAYPDITLLPPLARLLGTDLNTLLSFKEDLTRREIGQMLNEVTRIAQMDGTAAAFARAQTYLQEYPNCELLVFNMAMVLEGLCGLEHHSPPEWQQRVEALYQRAAEGDVLSVAEEAKAMQVRRYIACGELERAETLLCEIPDKVSYDKRRLKAGLFAAKGDKQAAARQLEIILLSGVSEVHSILLELMEIAQKIGCLAQAETFLQTIRQLTTLFGLWPGNAALADFLLAVSVQDTARCMAALRELLDAVGGEWHIGQTAHFSHLPVKTEKTETMFRALVTPLLADLEASCDDRYGFLHGCPEYFVLLNELKKVAAE